MEILTNLQRKILIRFSELPDKEAFYLTGGTALSAFFLKHIIRGKKVMLDKDLAALYGVETKMLNRAVKRNTERFPEDFMFQLTKEEYTALLRCQIGTLKGGSTANIPPMPLQKMEWLCFRVF